MHLNLVDLASFGHTDSGDVDFGDKIFDISIHICIVIPPMCVLLYLLFW